MKVHVPIHITAGWLASEAAPRAEAKSRGKTTYIKPKKFSIREFIARADQLQKS